MAAISAATYKKSMELVSCPPKYSLLCKFCMQQNIKTKLVYLYSDLLSECVYLIFQPAILFCIIVNAFVFYVYIYNFF